jgi:hypothetical protein
MVLEIYFLRAARATTHPRRRCVPMRPLRPARTCRPHQGLATARRAPLRAPTRLSVPQISHRRGGHATTARVAAIRGRTAEPTRPRTCPHRRARAATAQAHVARRGARAQTLQTTYHHHAAAITPLRARSRAHGRAHGRRAHARRSPPQQPPLPLLRSAPALVHLRASPRWPPPVPAPASLLARVPAREPARARALGPTPTPTAS